MRQINYSLVNARKAPNAIYKARGGSTGYRWVLRPQWCLKCLLITLKIRWKTGMHRTRC